MATVNARVLNAHSGADFEGGRLGLRNGEQLPDGQVTDNREEEPCGRNARVVAPDTCWAALLTQCGDGSCSLNGRGHVCAVVRLRTRSVALRLAGAARGSCSCLCGVALPIYAVKCTRVFFAVVCACGV